MMVLTPRTDFTAENFAPFGAVIERPAIAGERQFFSSWLGSENPVCRPVFHTNFVRAAVLPFSIGKLEKHPHAAQAFVPLDVSEYVVTVAPSNDDGSPVSERAQSFIVPGHLGVVYRAGVWHAGATVLSRDGSFAVLMWRGAEDDDVFADIDPLQISPRTGARTA